MPPPFCAIPLVGLEAATARSPPSLPVSRYGRVTHLIGFFIVLSVASSPAWANRECLVVGVSDGDTLTARCGSSDFTQVKVRLAEIDAPEKGHAFGQRARIALSVLCFGTFATIAEAKRDRYGRTVAKVSYRGHDASAELVRGGLAWVYVRYASPGTPLRAIESEARATRSGLWADENPVPPWEWRQQPSTRNSPEP